MRQVSSLLFQMLRTPTNPDNIQQLCVSLCVYLLRTLSGEVRHTGSSSLIEERVLQQCSFILNYSSFPHVVLFNWNREGLTYSAASAIGDSTGGPEGAQALLLKNKFLKILGKGCSID